MTPSTTTIPIEAIAAGACSLTSGRRVNVAAEAGVSERADLSASAECLGIPGSGGQGLQLLASPHQSRRVQLPGNGLDGVEFKLGAGAVVHLNEQGRER